MAHRIVLARSASLIFLAASALSCGALVGCSGGDGSSSSATSSAGNADNTEASLSPQGFAVETAPTTVTATSVVFPTTAEVQSFEVGDVIAAQSTAVALATPYIRTITAITVDSPAVGQTTFTTEVASLDQLLDDAELDQTVPVTDGDPAAAADLTGISENLALHPLDFVALPSADKEWNLSDDGDKGKVGLGGGGSIDFTESYFRISGGVNFAYSMRHWYDPLPKHLRLVLSGGISTRFGAKIRATAAVDSSAPEIDYGQYTLGTIVVTAGPIPIPIVIVMKFSGGASVGLDAKATLHDSVTAAFKLQAGFDYTSSSGVKGVSSFSRAVSHDPLIVDADVTGDVRLSPLDTEVEFRMFDVAGPSLGVRSYVGLQATKSTTDGVKVEGIYGVSLHAGGDLSVLHHKLTGIDVTLADIQETFPACSSASVCKN